MRSIGHALPLHSSPHYLTAIPIYGDWLAGHSSLLNCYYITCSLMLTHAVLSDPLYRPRSWLYYSSLPSDVMYATSALRGSKHVNLRWPVSVKSLLRAKMRHFKTRPLQNSFTSKQRTSKLYRFKLRQLRHPLPSKYTHFKTARLQNTFPSKLHRFKNWKYGLALLSAYVESSEPGLLIHMVLNFVCHTAKPWPVYRGLYIWVPHVD